MSALMPREKLAPLLKYRYGSVLVVVACQTPALMDGAEKPLELATSASWLKFHTRMNMGIGVAQGDLCPEPSWARMRHQ